MRLEAHERLYLWRRAAGITQADAAHVFHVTHRLFNLWELGQERPPKQFAPCEALVYAAEEAIVRRRRLGLTQEEAGSYVGWSRRWVHHVESGAEYGCDRLLALYEELEAWV